MIDLGEEFTDFRANSTIGEINYYEWLGTSWGMIFSYCADYNPVCTDELAQVVKLCPELAKRNVKPLALSCDTVENHQQWLRNIKVLADYSSDEFPYPIISDEERDLACRWQILDPVEKADDGIPVTARAVFIIDNKKIFRLSILYPSTVGRNFNEILRTIDALQITDKYPIATPANWKPGEKVMIKDNVSDEEAKKLFPNVSVVAFPCGNKYIKQVQI